MNKKQMLKEQKRIKEERKAAARLFNDDKEVYNVFKIGAGVILFLALAFVFVNIFNGNWNLFNKKNIETESLDLKKVMVGTMFNKSNDEYLVLAYDMNDDNQTVYTYLVDNYSSSNLYTLDLSSGFNSAFIGDTTVISNDLSQFKLSGPTLLVIKGNNIINSYTNQEDIIKYFETK